MSRAVHEFRDPARFVVGTVGQPGERVFFVQATEAGRTISVRCEKQQAQILSERMGDLLGRMEEGVFYRFESLFTAEEGRLGVLVTFLAMLELAKEQLLDVVQEAPLAPIYVKSLAAGNTNEPLSFSSEFDDSTDTAPRNPQA